MSDLFPHKDSYDNEGNLNVNGDVALQRSKMTFSPQGGIGGPLLNIFDMNSSTECLIATTTGTGELTFEFSQKPLFKNFIVDLRHDWVASTSTLTIEGSNDNSAWTVLATKSLTADGNINLIASDVNYKYVKIKVVHPGDASSWLQNVMATTA